ncbi:wiskott-Aldrich syndrome protein-like [Kryptolebias marmoratus]|uniref:wiskott-Aldrich syndrome protein-like n=1 Tax=Kryptolebias marmoratus TaxID=37003 RepID=UPI0007F8E7D0|nr:wiskott-Aldrich syndrome protein-like [Kryptolebias marmoratus]
MSVMINTTKEEVVSSSLSDLAISQNAKDENFYEEPDPLTALTTSLVSGLDPVMISLLKQANLTEEDLKSKDVAELVDCIISQFGGLKAVQTELRRKSTGSKTFPRAAGVSISAALQKGALPPIPPVKKNTNSQPASQDAAAESTSQSDSYVAFAPPSPTTGRLTRSASLKAVGSSAAAAEGCDPIVVALRGAFKQRKMLLQNTSECPDETGAKTN